MQASCAQMTPQSKCGLPKNGVSPIWGSPIGGSPIGGSPSPNGVFPIGVVQIEFNHLMGMDP